MEKVEGRDVVPTKPVVFLDTSALVIRKREAEAELSLVQQQLAEYEAGALGARGGLDLAVRRRSSDLPRLRSSLLPSAGARSERQKSKGR